MKDYSIANTTKEERIELVKSWQPTDAVEDDDELDIWEIYRDYIDGKKEIAECNAAIASNISYMTEEELEK